MEHRRRKHLQMLRVLCLLLAAVMLPAGGLWAGNEVEAVEPSQQLQARGVWHRPNVTGVEVDLAGICQVLDTFQKTGINLVFLETFYHGMTVYRSSMVPYYTGFDAFDYSPYPDYLSAFVAEAQVRGIEVHAWVEDFYIGVEENYFTRHLSQWVMLTKDGSIRHSEGKDYGGYIFLDPANPEVREYLVRFYDEMLTRFPQIAGLNLDYIRYPVSNWNDDTGYTDAAMEGFAAQAGITFPENAGRKEKVDAVAAQAGKWTQYRADQVTAFVAQVYEMVRSDHPGVLLSTAVFPDQEKSFADKKQDFSTWLERGYLDIITPMAYYDDVAALKRALEAMLPELSDCFCYAGISATYHDLSDQQVLAQMQAALDTGADGYVFFGSQSILNRPGYISLLENHRPEYMLLPHGTGKQLIELSTGQLERELTDAGEASENVQQLLQQLHQMAQLAEDTNLESMQQLYKQLRLLVKYNLPAYVSSQNLPAAQQTLEPLLRWIKIKTARLLAKTSDAGQIPELPEAPNVPTESTGSGQTVPSAAPSVPNQQQEPENEESKQTHVLWIWAAVAVLAAVGVACFYVIRKGRKKK